MVEDQLKAGELPCLVATSSLELGIDMGAVDLVLQVESPKSVTAGLQRIGRAGHNVGETSEGPHLPQVPRRPARVRGRRQAHARGADRDHRRAAQPARRARPADRRDGRLDRDADRRRPARAGAAHAHLRGAVARAARERARHARRALPVGGVRRAAPADRVGPRDGHDPRPQGLARAGDHQRGHDPRPRAVQRQPARRPPRRRARRGDGLRGAAGPGLPARRDVVADRGDHPRPRRRDAGAGRAGRGAVLEGRQRGPAARARRGDRRVLALGGRPGRGDAGGRLRPRPARGVEPARVPARAGGGDARRAERPHDRDRALPGRDRRLAAVRPVAVRRARARRVGAGAERAHPRRVRARVRRHLVGRRDHRPPPRRRRAAGHGARADRPGRGRGPRGRRAGRHRPVRRALPRERGPRAADPARLPGPPHPAVAAAAEVADAARGGQALRAVPDRARDLPRVPARRARPAGADRPAAQAARARAERGRGGDRDGVAVRVVAAVRLRRDLHVRGRPAERGAPRRGAGARPRAAARAARAGGAARADRRGRARAGRGRPAADLRADPRGVGGCAPRRAAPRR